MNILVTGGAGYIGSILTKVFIEWGNDVIVLDNLDGGNKEAISEDALFINGDYGDKDVLKRIFLLKQIDIVVHHGSSVSPSGSLGNPKLYYDNNIRSGINLINTMLEYNVMNIMFASSGCVYGQPIEIPVKEDTILKPINPYGETKYAYENLIKWYNYAYGLNYIIMRYFNVGGSYGDLSSWKMQHGALIPNILAVVNGRKDKLEVYGNDYETQDGSCIRDYIHIKDIVRFYWKALNILNHTNGIYNLGSGVGYSVLEVIEESCKVLKRNIPYDITERHESDPAVLIADINKAREEVGWKPKYELSSNIKDEYKWLQKYPNGYNG